MGNFLCRKYIFINTSCTHLLNSLTACSFPRPGGQSSSIGYAMTWAGQKTLPFRPYLPEIARRFPNTSFRFEVSGMKLAKPIQIKNGDAAVIDFEQTGFFQHL